MPLLLVGVFAALFSPARAALLPTLIRRDQLVRANGMIAGLGIIGAMIAYQLGGYVAHRYGAAISFQLNAATFLVSAMLLAMLVLPRRHAGTDDARAGHMTLHDLTDGFRYVWCHRRVMELLGIAALLWFCGYIEFYPVIAMFALLDILLALLCLRGRIPRWVGVSVWDGRWRNSPIGNTIIARTSGA